MQPCARPHADFLPELIGTASSLVWLAIALFLGKSFQRSAHRFVPRLRRCHLVLREGVRVYSRCDVNVRVA